MTKGLIFRLLLNEPKVTYPRRTAGKALTMGAWAGGVNEVLATEAGLEDSYLSFDDDVPAPGRSSRRPQHLAWCKGTTLGPSFELPARAIIQRRQQRNENDCTEHCADTPGAP